MKKFTKQTLLLLATLVSFWASAQNLISPITINLPANPPANTAEWATSLPPVMILAQTKLANGQINPSVIESRILVTIKKGGTKVCGTFTPQTAPMSGFNNATKNWTGANVLALLGQECILQPGSYELCVEFFGFNATAQNNLLGQNCKRFTIPEKTVETFSPPVNVMPTNKKILTEKEIKAPLTFRWTPIVPKPKLPVTYRLKVWQLMQGQNSTQAMKANAPLLEKDVTNVTQATVANLLTGPCKPPYLCDFVWNIEASITNQNGQIEMLGSSEPTAFMVSSAGCGTNKDSVKVTCGEVIQGVQTYQVTVLFNNIIPTAGGQQCITIMNSITSTSGTISGLATLPVTIPIGGTTPAVTFTYTPAVAGATTAAFLYFGTWNDGFSNSSNFGNSNVPLPNCRCNLCDSNVVKWTLPTTINYNSSPTNNIATLTGPLSFGPYPIVKLSTEIVDFYWYTIGDCKKCNTNDYYFGNLISGTLGSMLGGTSVAGPGGTPIPTSHQLDFISPTLSGVSLSNTLNLNISLPPQTQLGCCNDCFRFCIRYTATFMQNGVCKTCSIVKCYETIRKHKQTEYGLQTNQCGERIIRELPNGDFQTK